jgi:glutamate formiminotransferase
MSAPLYQCIPNFSEGRHPETIEALADAIRSAKGVRLIDYSADADHHRCVLTLLGTEEAIREAMLQAVPVALERIDLRTHSGAHPRTGALDVLPIVPLRHATRENAVELARELGREIAERFALPVYFYEWAAVQGRQTDLPEIRRGGFEAFAQASLVGKKAPDCGPSKAHPSGGIAIVGARAPLIAYNINLNSPDLATAKEIARRIRAERETRAELAGARALGLFLPSQNRAQVSMNLTQTEATTLPRVFAYVQEQAQSLGATPMESEVIGAIPLRALEGKPPHTIRWHGYRPTQILETWLETE